MHESSIAKQLLGAVLERAERENATRVLSVRAWVAETEQLGGDALAAHFESHATSTIAAGANLELRITLVQARCDGCATLYVPDHGVRLCPACGSTDAVLLGDTGLGIDAIEMEI